MTDSAVLPLTALSVGLLHTVLGPDHYLPFVALARAGRWTLRRAIVVTILCGLAHVAGSLALALFGAGLGRAVFEIRAFEAFRGRLAGWLLTAFGLTYLLWGLRQAIRNRPHAHLHVHADGTIHSHPHVHQAGHLHLHTSPATRTAAAVHAPPDGHDGVDANAPRRGSAGAWALFILFLFGPCEPLIPLLMYPAMEGDAVGVLAVVLPFTAVTLAAMAAAVALLYHGSLALPFPRLGRYAHACAGLVLLACGIAIQAGL
jgi:ABC-type nickel/cobalt efflux system permease component RcnA